MRNFFAAAFIILAILSPPMTILPGFSTVRGEDLVIVLFLLAQWLRPDSSFPRRPHSCQDNVSSAFALMIGVAVLAISASSLQKQIVFNDFMILPMLLRYWLIYRIAQSFFLAGTRRLIMLVLLLAIGTSAIIGCLQFYNVASINTLLTPYYMPVRPSANDLSAMAYQVGLGNMRVIGTTGDPRHFGYMLVLGMAVGVSIFFHSRQTSLRVLSTGVVSICIVALIFTASRTAVACVIVMAIASVLLLQWTSGINTGTLSVMLLVVLLCTGVAVRFTTNTFKSRVMDTQTESFEMSAHARKRDLMMPFTAALGNPSIFLVGIGPSKADTRESSHNDVGWYFHRYGLLGVGCYLSLLLNGIRHGYHRLKTCVWHEERAVLMAALLVMVNWSIFLMGENVFKNVQLMSLNMFFLGLLFPVAFPLSASLTAMSPRADGNVLARRQHLLHIRG